MGIRGPFPVDSMRLFESGVFAMGEAMAITVYGVDPPVQERDKDSGLPLWGIDVMDGDPGARKDARAFRVKIAAAVQPVLPDPIPGTPFRPVVLEGMTVTVYLERDRNTDKPLPKMAYAIRATGVSTVKRADASKVA